MELKLPINEYNALNEYHSSNPRIFEAISESIRSNVDFNDENPELDIDPSIQGVEAIEDLFVKTEESFSANSKTVYHFLACYGIIKNFGPPPKEHDEQKWADYFWQLSKRTSGKASLEIGAYLAIILNDLFGQKILSLLRWINPNSNNRVNWFIHRSVLPGLPYMQYSPDDLELFLREIIIPKSDQYRGIYRATFLIGEFDASKAERIAAHFEGKDDLVSYYQNLLVALSRNRGARSVFQRVLDLVDSDSLENSCQGINAISRLQYDLEREGELTTTAVDQILAKESMVSPNRPEIFVNAIFNVRQFDDRIPDKILDLCKSEETVIIRVVSQEFWIRREELQNEPFFNKGVMSLANFKVADDAIVEHTGYVLSDFININPEMVLDWLSVWIENRSGTPLISNSFEYLLNSILDQNSDLFEQILTDWLSADNPTYHIAAMEALKIVTRHRSPRVSFSEKMLALMTESDFRFLMYKTLAWVEDKELCSQLLFSIIGCKNLPQAIEKEISELYRGYLLYNYRSLLHVLKQYSKSENIRQKRVANRIQREFNKYQKAKKGLPNLREFRPPRERLEYFHRRLRKAKSQVMEESMDEGIMEIFGPRTVLKCHTWFLKYEGEYTEPKGMGSVSSEVELPAGKFIDPIQQQILLRRWVSYRRQIK